MSAINQEKASLYCRNILVSLPVLLVGGTEIQTLNLARVLVSAGYRVTICCYYEYDETMVSEFHFAGAKVILMSLKRSDGILHLMQKMKKIFKMISPDILHVQYIAPGLIPIIASRLSGVRTVFATVHQPGRPYGLKEKLFLRLGAYLCTAFFCVSKSAEKSWFGNSEILNPQNVNRKRKHFTIYNAVDVSIYNQEANLPNRNQLKKSLGLDGCSVVGIVGRLRKEKGHENLLNAMAEVVEIIPNAQLLIVGDGPDRELLEKRTERLGFAENVRWMGSKKPSEVFELYAVMDVVVVPSLFEGFGLSAAEAMAAGRSVVASNVDGLSEVVEDGVTGYLMPVNDDRALAGRLIQLLNNPAQAQAMGRKGRDRVSRLFSMERFSESIRAAYSHFS